MKPRAVALGHPDGRDAVRDPGSGANHAWTAHWSGDRCAERCPAWRDGDCDVTRADRQSNDALRAADGRCLFPALPTGTYTLTLRAVRISEAGARKHPGLDRSDDLPSTRGAADCLLAESVTVSARPLWWMSPAAKSGLSLSGRSADRRSEFHRRLGARCRKRPASGCRIRRRRQPQEPAVGLRSASAFSNQSAKSSPTVSITPEGIGGTGFYEDYFANEEVSVERARQRRRR